MKLFNIRIGYSVGLCAICVMGSNAWAVQTLVFTPDPTRSTQMTSPEGCHTEPGPAQGGLLEPGASGACHSGSLGTRDGGAVRADSREIGGERHQANASFLSQPQPRLLHYSGPARFTLYFADQAPELERPANPVPNALYYEFHRINSSGGRDFLQGGPLLDTLPPARGDGRWQRIERNIPLRPMTLYPGTKMMLSLYTDGPESADGRLLYGGSFKDAGIVFSSAEGVASGNTGGSGGSFPATSLCVLLLGAWAGRRRPGRPRL